MAKNSEFIVLALVALVAGSLMALKVSQIYIVVTVMGLGIGVPWLISRGQRSTHVAQYGRELGEPFLVEVLLEGEAVAALSEREFTEMFWRNYRITPLTDGGAKVIADDDLWGQCRFTFRDPATGVHCDTAFAGGAEPFARDGFVSIRGLYFKTDAVLIPGNQARKESPSF